ncbi:MAG: glycosyltransferase family 4 protein [Methanomassiliicoccales archaeon]|nr:glycosyltransferase family 4 protein [Methanomassiliicoccales archaeon]
MNIWIFNQYAHPPDLPGGTRHYDLGKELVKKGHKVTIFATSFHHYLHRETRLQPGEKWKVEETDGIKFVWLRTPPYHRNDWRRARNMVAFMLRAWRLGIRLPRLFPEVEKPDVVIGSSVHLLTPLAAYLVARHFRVPFVMEVRDLWPQAIIDVGELSAGHPLVKALQALERFLYRRAERIIILGPQMKEYITACGIDQEKICWIPNGIDLSSFDRLSKQSLRKSSDDFYVLYLGAHSMSNALDVVIRAAELVQAKGYKSIKFVLVGDGPTKESLIALAQSLAITNVCFRNSVAKTDVPKVLKEADALLLTKHPTFGAYSGSILKLMDYMAAAKPILYAARTIYNPVETSRCGLVVNPGDPQALAEAIIKLYQMPQEEREAMGRRGRQYVEKYHAIPTLANKLEQILREVVTNS